MTTPRSSITGNWSTEALPLNTTTIVRVPPANRLQTDAPMISLDADNVTVTGRIATAAPSMVLVSVIVPPSWCVTVDPDTVAFPVTVDNASS
jgi:hypothetical protein